MVRKRFDRFGAQTTYKFNWQPEEAQAGANSQQVKLPKSIVETLEGSKKFVATPESAAPEVAGITAKAGRRTRRRGASWGWSLLWLIALSVCGGMGTIAFVRLTRLPPLPNCQQISPMAADMERLYCAQAAAYSGDLSQLIAGLELVEHWSDSHPLHREAQGAMADWSKAILAIAREKISHNDLEGAIEVTRRIPETSPVYADAQAAIVQWQQQWQRGEEIYETAQTALKQQNWNHAAEQVVGLARLENDHWRERADALTQQILAEKRAWQHLTEARELAEDGKPEELGAAIARVRQVDAQSYAWTQAKADLDRWSQALLTVGKQRWQQGDLAGAIALAQQVPSDSTSATQAQDLTHISRAQQLVTQSDSRWQPDVGQIWGLVEALAAVRQIKSDSPFHAQAQTKIQDWQGQLQDLVQLQFASVTASLGQRHTFQIAIDQAQLVAADRPRRMQAQTLVAHWTQEIQRIEDRPHITRALQFAEPGTIPALKTAIAHASQIAIGRARRVEAQGLIARWNRQIETIEDQPFLDEARTLAQRGRLGDAIEVAEKIDSGRALYQEAQAAIGNWRAQIQIAQDRRILDEAIALAAEGSLTAAIDVASQIGSGALYREAQAAIAEWDDERQEIWATWEAEPDSLDSSYDESYDESYDDYYDESY